MKTVTRITSVLIFVLVLVSNRTSTARASDLEDLAEDGFGVVEKTQVNGEFEGCDFDKRIPLVNGLVFVCTSYSYSYGYMPDVLILKSVRTGEIKILIDEEEYDGTLYESQ